MSWSSKRQASIILSVIGIALIPVAYTAYKIMSVPATCNDNSQNQGEVGVDCGGPCSLLCSSQIAKPIVTWKRLFLVGGGVYNMVAYIENPNAQAGTKKIGYQLRVFNTEGVSIYERHGTTVIPAKRSVPVIETGINLNQQTPSRIEFKLDDTAVWSKESVKEIPLATSNSLLTEATTSPRLNTNLSNKDIVKYSNFEVVAILYDEDGNAVGASSTYVDKIDAGATLPLIFTWPEPFSETPARIEIIPKLFI